MKRINWRGVAYQGSITVAAITLLTLFFSGVGAAVVWVGFTLSGFEGATSAAFTAAQGSGTLVLLGLLVQEAFLTLRKVWEWSRD